MYKVVYTTPANRAHCRQEHYEIWYYEAPDDWESVHAYLPPYIFPIPLQYRFDIKVVDVSSSE